MPPYRMPNTLSGLIRSARRLRGMGDVDDGGDDPDSAADSAAAPASTPDSTAAASTPISAAADTGSGYQDVGPTPSGTLPSSPTGVAQGLQTAASGGGGGTVYAQAGGTANLPGPSMMPAGGPGVGTFLILGGLIIGGVMLYKRKKRKSNPRCRRKSR